MKKDILYPLRRVHGCLYDHKLEKQNAYSLKEEIKNTDLNTAFFVMTPTHGNLGDHAIAAAAARMLDEIGVEYKEITLNQLMLLEKYKLFGSMNGHTILVNGGGNLGTLWPVIERLFRGVILNNPDSNIICLPNTIYYEDSAAGRKSLGESVEIYNKHKHLLLCARDKSSFDFMKPIYNDVELIPDLVMSLNKCAENTKRSGCLICIRRDIERTLEADAEEKIKLQLAESFGGNIRITNMCVDHPVSPEARQEELNAKFEEFRKAELVITDRLHGMIFSAITGTPCIVADSKSPKIRGGFEWLEGLEYIKFAESIDELKNVYESMPRKDFLYSNSMLTPYYDELKLIIRDFCWI